MSNAALVERLDRDMFKTDMSSNPLELQRRLNIFMEEMYDIVMQLSGNLVVNQNITYYADTSADDPNESEEVVESGRTITVNGLDDTGKSVQLSFITGRLQD